MGFAAFGVEDSTAVLAGHGGHPHRMAGTIVGAVDTDPRLEVCRFADCSNFRPFWVGE